MCVFGFLGLVFFAVVVWLIVFFLFFLSKNSSLILSFYDKTAVEVEGLLGHLLINNVWKAQEEEDLGLINKLLCSPPLFVTHSFFMKHSQIAWGGMGRRERLLLHKRV